MSCLNAIILCEGKQNKNCLNIIEIPYLQSLDAPEKYKQLENHPMIKNPVSGDTSRIHYNYRHKMFKLTNFGVNFVKLVCHNEK